MNSPPTREQLYALQSSDPIAFQRALRRQRWRQFGVLWARLGASLSFIGSILLGVIYLTLFAPFGIAGRLVALHERRGWQDFTRKLGKTPAELRYPG
jgi:hypothetical protein